MRAWLSVRRSPVAPLVGLLIAVAVSAMSLPGCDSNTDRGAPPRVQAAELFDFGSLEEMMAASDVVVEGTIMVLSPGRIVGGDPALSSEDTDALQFLELQVTVDRVLRGVLPTGEKTILIEESAGSIENPDLVGVYGSQVGDHGYYFLGWKDGTPYYYMLNSESRFLIRGDQVEASNPSDEWVAALEGLTPEELSARMEEAAAAVG